MYGAVMEVPGMPEQVRELTRSDPVVVADAHGRASSHAGAAS
jgi:hypothetical protein